MKWTSSIIEPRLMSFVIKLDRTAGYYLYVYENGQEVRDDLQDTLEWAKTVAYKDYGVPKDSWREVE